MENGDNEQNTLKENIVKMGEGQWIHSGSSEDIAENARWNLEISNNVQSKSYCPKNCEDSCDLEVDMDKVPCYYTFSSMLCPLDQQAGSKGLQRGSGTMYGILLESIQVFIQKDYGKEVWMEILNSLGMKNIVFSTHKLYKDEIMTGLAKHGSKIIGNKTEDEIMKYFGSCFVNFCRQYGYAEFLSLSGRHFRDFLIGIDNIHETIRFSYPQLQSPSFYVEAEDPGGCILVYRSKRVGFQYYVIGQMQQCAKLFYNIQVKIRILHEHSLPEGGCAITYRLEFQNIGFIERNVTSSPTSQPSFCDVSGTTFLKVFPFCIVFDADLMIRFVGDNIPIALENYSLIGSYMPSKFLIRRPLVEFTWENTLRLQQVTFEFQYRHPVKRTSCLSLVQMGESPQSSTAPRGQNFILKGQMKYIDDWAMTAFLCRPLLGNVEEMEKFSIYLNDLSMFDNSREMIMRETQHASHLEFSIEQQIRRSMKISENLQKLDEWQQKSNALLYSMIPESIANRLKEGKDPISTCEVFDKVTILFSYLVGFTDICALATPMDIVQCINNVFVGFDAIVDQHGCFKVETLGDAVYMVAGGIPDRRPDHAAKIAGLALELLQLAGKMKDPVTSKPLQLRIGMHTGSVVGGVIGRRMPQYCLFGDTVNTASRMQSYSMPGRIHLSEPCHICLKGCGYVTVFRGTVDVKGKGNMKTYWLVGREGETNTVKLCQDIRQERILNKKKTLYRSFENGFDFRGLHSVTSSANFKPHFDLFSDDHKIRRGSEASIQTPKKIQRSNSLSIFMDYVEQQAAKNFAKELKPRKISLEIVGFKSKTCLFDGTNESPRSKNPCVINVSPPNLNKTQLRESPEFTYSNLPSVHTDSDISKLSPDLTLGGNRGDNFATLVEKFVMLPQNMIKAKETNSDFSADDFAPSSDPPITFTAKGETTTDDSQSEYPIKNINDHDNSIKNNNDHDNPSKNINDHDNSIKNINDHDNSIKTINDNDNPNKNINDHEKLSITIAPHRKLSNVCSPSAEEIANLEASHRLAHQFEKSVPSSDSLPLKDFSDVSRKHDHLRSSKCDVEHGLSNCTSSNGSPDTRHIQTKSSSCKISLVNKFCKKSHKSDSDMKKCPFSSIQHPQPHNTHRSWTKSIVQHCRNLGSSKKYSLKHPSVTENHSVPSNMVGHFHIDNDGMLKNGACATAEKSGKPSENEKKVTFTLTGDEMTNGCSNSHAELWDHHLGKHELKSPNGSCISSVKNKKAHSFDVCERPALRNTEQDKKLPQNKTWS